MYRVKLTKESIANHLHYDKLKYFFGFVIVSLLWFVILTMFAPKTPADKKVDIYFIGGPMSYANAEKLGSDILDNFPELLEINFDNIETDKDTDMNFINTQKLLTRMQSKSGDIFILSKNDFKRWTLEGAFTPVDDVVSDLSELLPEEDLEEMKMSTEYDEDEKIYGIPIYDMILLDNIYDISDAVIAIPHYSKNKEKAIEVIKWMFNENEKEKNKREMEEND